MPALGALHYSHESKAIFGKIMDTLLDTEDVVCIERDTGGRKRQKVYLLRETPGGDVK